MLQVHLQHRPYLTMYWKCERLSKECKHLKKQFSVGRTTVEKVFFTLWYIPNAVLIPFVPRATSKCMYVYLTTTILLVRVQSFPVDLSKDLILVRFPSVGHHRSFLESYTG